MELSFWAPVPAPLSPVPCTYTAYSTSSPSESNHGVLWGQTDHQGHSPGGKVARLLGPHSPGSGVAPSRRGNATLMSNAACVGLGKFCCHLPCCSDVSLTSLASPVPMPSLRGLPIALTLRGKCKDLSNALLLSLLLRPLFLLSTSQASPASLDFHIPYPPLYQRQML